MATNENKKLYGREELKKYFRNGEIPSEKHYQYLIDSVINRQDDGFSKDEDRGFIVSPMGTSKRLVTFFKGMDEMEPMFYIEKDTQQNPSLRFQPNMDSKDAGKMEENSFFFHQDGRLGIGKRSDPVYKVDVNGFMGMSGRIGTHISGCVPADGKWQTIIKDLDNCHAYEIIARTGKKGKGKFAILHAVALSAYGGSRHRIRKTSAYYGFFWNRLSLRWTGKTHDFKLELRTNRNYGKDVDIYYHITRLWDDELFMPEDYYYPQKS